jgi:hypothetical protein
LSQQIERASTEGHSLPAEQRSFYEERLGHDFNAVRIHNGPASAAAAASLRAEAFTRGQDIYFGQGFYRPEHVSGQRLMAHELAHTVQQRPNTIARRALDGVATVESPPAEGDTSTAETTTPSTDVDETDRRSPGATAAEIRGLLTSDPSDTSGQARRRVNRQPPSARHQVTTALLANEDEPSPRQEGVARVIGATLARAGAVAPSAEGPTARADRDGEPRKERPGTPGARAVQSAAASAPPPAPTTAPPATSVPDVASTQPSIAPRVPPTVARASPPVRAPSPPAAPPTPAPEPAQVERARAEAKGETPPQTATTDRAVGAKGTGGAPGGGGPAAAMGAAEDDGRPLRLADLFKEPAPKPPEGEPDAAGGQMAAPMDTLAPPPRMDATAGAGGPPESELGTRPDEDTRSVESPRSGETGAQMESLAAELETSLAATRESLQAQATTISRRVRQHAAGARAGIRAEVNQAMQRILAGQTSLLSDLSSMVAITHGLINASLALRKLGATVTGIASQISIRGIFSGHRSTVERTVNNNIDAAERLRARKAEEVQKRNRADFRTCYIKGGAKMRTYPGTNRGAYIGCAAFDVAEGVAKEIRKQEPDILSGVAECTAPLPQYFREQGAQALDGFDVNLPKILASVDTGVTQTQGDQDKRGREAHAQLDSVAAQTRVEISLLALEAIGQAAAFGPQVEARLDRELGQVLRAIAATPRDVMNRIAPPIEEAIALMRTGEKPDVDAAKELTGGLKGFLDESASSTVDTMEHAAETSRERFQGMRSGARQAMHAQAERMNKVWQGARTGFASLMATMLSNFDTGFAGSVTTLRETLTETEQSIRDQLAPVISQLDGTFGDTLRDAEGKIDGRINEGLAKNTEALNALDGKMAEAASQAAYEWDHPILSSIESTLSFLAGLIVGIVTVLALVAVLLVVGWAIAAVLGVSMLTAGLIMLAGMAAFSIGYAFGARLAAGQGIGEAFIGAVGDFGRAAPGMLYEMTGIPKLRRAFSDERMTPYERGKLIGEGGTELVLAVFMVRGAAKGIAAGFRHPPGWRGHPRHRPASLLVAR